MTDTQAIDPNDVEAVRAQAPSRDAVNRAAALLERSPTSCYALRSLAAAALELWEEDGAEIAAILERAASELAVLDARDA